VDGEPCKVRVARGNEISLFPVLLCAHGDTPWSAKLAGGCGHTAANACHRCGLTGTKTAPNGEKLPAVSFGGTSEPSACRSFDSRGFHDSTICYSHPLPNGSFTFNQEGSARICTTDDKYDMRANAAEMAAAEEYNRFGDWYGRGDHNNDAASASCKILDMHSAIHHDRVYRNHMCPWIALPQETQCTVS
jgi:hypothetical protein